MEVKEEKLTVLDYFNGDELAADVFMGKYAIKEDNEQTPKDMHERLAHELARAEKKYTKEVGVNGRYKDIDKLSEFGQRLHAGNSVSEWFIMEYLDKFRYIVPQGSIMTMLGNKHKIGSLSNCFVIPSPVDSYGGILQTDEQLVQLMKRRGGVGFNINTLRPSDTPVSNAAGTSTGAASFMHRFSNSTREVAQNGRRGALMLLISCLHPDVFKFVNMKKDRTAVTGANISVMLTDKFMRRVEENEDFICRFPVDSKAPVSELYIDMKYNTLTKIDGIYVMKIRAKELYDMIVENAWENAEPGVAFIDRVVNYSPDGVYDQFRPIASNPCGEQWMQAYDACRLLALNLFSIVRDPFTKKATIDYEKLYEIAYIQQRLADDIVDLEIEHIERIREKIISDPENMETKRDELLLWNEVKRVAIHSRRTGCGFTGLGDMLAALGLKYDSKEALIVTKAVMKKKMEAELDCTIDLAVLRGTFVGWDNEKEFPSSKDENKRYGNDFYYMLQVEFPEQVARMMKYGRRNVSWSTVAPTGTVSLMTQTTSGLEPLFLPYYMRRKKINANDPNSRVDFVDQNGDTWQEFAVLHPKFKDWILSRYPDAVMEEIPKTRLQDLFEQSPWYMSTANDISWEKRIEIQAVIQKYTTNAISSTMNLPENVKKEVIGQIYMEAWKKGLKGVTVYRDNCRTGVLVSETVKKSSFDYSDAIKRPKEIGACIHSVSVKGVRYAVIVGTIDEKPYEIFAFKSDSKDGCGKLVKVKKGHYKFVYDEGDSIEDVQELAINNDELVLTRLVSGMLRHGAKPQFVMEQIDKCDLEVVSYGKAVSRVLKKYVKDEEMVSRNNCKDCGSSNVRMQEGCLTCMDCGSSKC